MFHTNILPLSSGYVLNMTAVCSSATLFYWSSGLHTVYNPTQDHNMNFFIKNVCSLILLPSWFKKGHYFLWQPASLIANILHGGRKFCAWCCFNLPRIWISFILVQYTGVNIRFLFSIIKEGDGNVILQFTNVCHI